MKNGPRTPSGKILKREIRGEALAQFWQPLPKPGFHDIFGLVKIGRGRIDGDILCLVKNLRFFKDFMALARPEFQTEELA